MKLMRKITSVLVVSGAIVSSLPGITAFADVPGDEITEEISQINNTKITKEIFTEQGRQVLTMWRDGNYLKVTIGNREYRAHIYNDYVGYRYNTTGAPVYVAQVMLTMSKDFSGAIDGKFGEITRQGVERFQRRKGLSVDSIIGPNTWIALYNDIIN